MLAMYLESQNIANRQLETQVDKNTGFLKKNQTLEFEREKPYHPKAPGVSKSSMIDNFLLKLFQCDKTNWINR